MRKWLILAPPALRTSVIRGRGEAVLVVAGDLDAASAADFREALAAAASLREPTLCVDLRSTSYLDSSAVYALLDVWRRCDRRPGALRLVCRPGFVARILRLGGLGAVLETEPADIPRRLA
jgi:anti-sigma B factor antagonist